HLNTTRTSRVLGDVIRGLPLGADEKEYLPGRRLFSYELRRFFEHLERLLHIDDVNAIALSEDVFLHLGIPALRLMPEVNTRFEQLLHGDVSQLTSSDNLHPSFMLANSGLLSRPRTAKQIGRAHV